MHILAFHLSVEQVACWLTDIFLCPLSSCRSLLNYSFQDFAHRSTNLMCGTSCASHAGPAADRLMHAKLPAIALFCAKSVSFVAIARPQRIYHS